MSYVLELRHAVLYDSSMQFRELKNLLAEAAKDRLFVGLVVVALVLAYAAEIGSPTFNTDAFQEIQSRGGSAAWFAYGRYAADALRAATWAVYPPSLVLMVGVGLLAVTVTILTGMWAHHSPRRTGRCSHHRCGVSVLFRDVLLFHNPARRTVGDRYRRCWHFCSSCGWIPAAGLGGLLLSIGRLLRGGRGAHMGGRGGAEQSPVREASR